MGSIWKWSYFQYTPRPRGEGSGRSQLAAHRGQDLEEDFEPFRLQGGYDHNFEVFCSPAAILRDPGSGRTMAVSTDLPGLQFYSGNYLKDQGKDGVYYPKRSGIALETQFYPDSVNHPEWPQPFTPANTPYHSETLYEFT